ncbi:MAG TPA: LPS assembly protein LptD, partial [Verrucomicrobiae bacterium]
YWDNWSLDALAAPRVNDFFSQVERLPDVQLTGFRQEIFDTPFYYDSQSSVGFYRIWDANATNGFYPLTNGVYGDTGMRADTYHQITLPWTFFHWLNVAPRAGGRFTYYNAASDASGRNTDVSRGVFNTGMEVSFKATALWKDAKSSLLQVDGLRHIMEPSVNYVFVPNPSLPPSQLPQYDGEMGALLISPLMFPDYNSIDSIDTMNVMRFGLRNVLQTKRNGQLDDLLNWNLMLDCRLDRQAGQSRLNDLYSQFAIRPRDWLTLEEQLRYDTERGHLNLSFHQVTFTPNDRWSWGVGHLYIHQGTWGLGTWDENSYLTSTAFFRVSDNWGLRAQHNFNVRDGRLQQQYYSVYRDLRSVTAALTFRVQDDVRNSPDYTVALQVSLKLQPNRKVGDDVVNPYRLVGE